MGCPFLYPSKYGIGLVGPETLVDMSGQLVDVVVYPALFRSQIMHSMNSLRFKISGPFFLQHEFRINSLLVRRYFVFNRSSTNDMMPP